MRYLLALGLAAPSSALACGGFFCNQQDPVDQSSEKIVFEVHEGKVDVHVQVQFQGNAEDFAWIVPVAEVPDLFLSTEDLFTQLSRWSQPIYSLTRSENGNCVYPRPEHPSESYTSDSGWDSVALADSGESEDGGINIVGSAQIGSYDTVTLQAETPEALLEWLQDNDYAIPADLVNGPLAPYVANDSYFVALKLAADASSGTLAPLGMSYPGSVGSIPIQLTSVAATPDMRLEVHVFGEHRAVPSNYLHVQTNDMAIDWLGAWWFGYPQNTFDVITRAANEAGGHAFATEFAGSPRPLEGFFRPDGSMDTTNLEFISDPFEFFFALQNRGFQGNNSLLEVLRMHWPVPPELNIPEFAFYNCMDCYVTADELPFDPAAMKADLHTFVIDPLQRVEDMVGRSAKWTRLTSSLSPVEMTLDPQFVLNDGMPDVPREHTAELIYECGEESPVMEAPRRLVVQDGRSMLIPPEGELSGGDYAAWINALDLPRALVVARTGASEEPQIIADYSDFEPVTGVELDDPDGLRNGKQPLNGCSGGCSNGGSVGWVALLPLLAFRRRA